MSFRNGSPLEERWVDEGIGLDDQTVGIESLLPVSVRRILHHEEMVVQSHSRRDIEV